MNVCEWVNVACCKESPMWQDTWNYLPAKVSWKVHFCPFRNKDCGAFRAAAVTDYIYIYTHVYIFRLYRNWQELDFHGFRHGHRQLETGWLSSHPFFTLLLSPPSGAHMQLVYRTRRSVQPQKFAGTKTSTQTFALTAWWCSLYHSDPKHRCRKPELVQPAVSEEQPAAEYSV